MNRYKNSTYVSFGDSITARAGASNFYGYVDVIKENVGASTLINKGVAGSTISTNITALSTVDFTTVGFVTLMTGTNGVGNLGSINDVKTDYTQNSETFYGYLGYFVEYIRTRNPRTRIFFLTPPKGNGMGASSLPNVKKAMQEVGELLSVPVIDVYGECGFSYSDASNSNNTYFIDSAHPSPLGHELIGEYVAAKILSM